MTEKNAVQTVMWTEWDERERQYLHKTLHQGVKGEVPDEVVARMDRLTEEDGMPRLLDDDDYEAWNVEVARKTDPAYALSDTQIQALDSQSLVGQLNQNPAMAQRVLDLENERDRPRKPIITLAERIIAASQGEDVSLADEQPSTLTPSSE